MHSGFAFGGLGFALGAHCATELWVTYGAISSTTLWVIQVPPQLLPQGHLQDMFSQLAWDLVSNLSGVL